MIDIILYAPNKATLLTFAENHPPINPLASRNADNELVIRQGVDYCWWAGSGKFMTQVGTYDAEGNEITPPTYLPGVVALMRIYGSFFESNILVPDSEDPDKDEQWARSKIAKYIKDNGTPGTMGGIPYYEIDSVRLFRPTDVEEFLANNNIPGHIWVGGNQY